MRREISCGAKIDRPALRLRHFMLSGVLLLWFGHFRKRSFSQQKHAGHGDSVFERRSHDFGWVNDASFDQVHIVALGYESAGWTERLTALVRTHYLRTSSEGIEFVVAPACSDVLCCPGPNTTPAGPSNMVDETKESVGTQPARRAAERRTQPRYRFTAAAELLEEKSGTQTEARIADISQRGCYVETGRAFPLGTAIRVSISKGPDRLVTEARVVYSSVKGMGLLFSEIVQGQVQILEAWLGPLREKDLLTLNHRRTQRVLMRVPIRVSGRNTLASQFDEQTYTLAVNVHGASILLFASVKNGQRLKLVNVATGDEAECIVAYVGQRQDDQTEVGISFVLANPRFWHVAFPPHDWTRP